MLIDDITIKIFAGKGGKGRVAFDKTRMAKGPTGGNGGNGGSIYFEGVSNLSSLKQFRYQKEVRAEDGEEGKGQLKDGANAEDVILKIPVGTIIHNLSNGQKIEITKIGEKVLIAKGGKGGKGNNFFKSSTNTTPMQFQKGLPGEAFIIRLELKLIADIGLIGLPNAGKSTLLNELTSASSKVANYCFTTLEPHLGVYYELILADIPGLIEGASVGKGLGIKFLRHIERTQILFHLISAESEDPKKDYEVIRKELEKYNPEILKKEEYIFISKSDAIDEKELKKKLKLFKNTLPISILDEESMNNVKKILNTIIAKKKEV
ncbi:MAG: GTPase ObgE [Candidatus Pacebacteria bacterium]|nr:GTPase ObgE [Candidatus Paceibacterota bacterium]